MRARSSLSELQRSQLVELFEQGVGYTTAASRLGVARDPVGMCDFDGEISASVADLRILPANRLVKLKGTLEGCFSFRVNSQ